MKVGRFVAISGVVRYFRKVKESDEGPYICRAENEGGQTDEMVWLIIRSKFITAWGVRVETGICYHCSFYLCTVKRELDLSKKNDPPPPV